ncbi:MAG: hypothetical protein IH950_06525 [Bacteroidetes bacterium]|nr:hypothetical protein [Bacteroidota bacterium]
MKTSITHSIKMLILVSTAFVFIVPKLSFAQYNINIAAHIVRDDNGNLGISENDVTASINQIIAIYSNNGTNINFELASIDYLDDDAFVNVVRGSGSEHSQQAQDLFNMFTQPGCGHDEPDQRRLG